MTSHSRKAVDKLIFQQFILVCGLLCVEIFGVILAVLGEKTLGTMIVFSVMGYIVGRFGSAGGKGK